MAGVGLVAPNKSEALIEAGCGIVTCPESYTLEASPRMAQQRQHNCASDAPATPRRMDVKVTLASDFPVRYERINVQPADRHELVCESAKEDFSRPIESVNAAIPLLKQPVEGVEALSAGKKSQILNAVVR